MYIFLFIGVVVVWLRIHKNIKKAKVNFKYVYINYLLLLFFILLLMPPFSNILLMITQFDSAANMIFTIVLAYLFYASFLNELTTAKQASQIEQIARELSILKNDFK